MKLGLMIAAQVLTIATFAFSFEQQNEINISIMEYVGMSVISFALIYLFYTSYKALSKFSA